MTEFLNQELDLYAIAAVTELFVLFIAACAVWCSYKSPAEAGRKVWKTGRLLHSGALVLLAFTPVSILAGCKESPLAFLCMFLGAVIAAAGASAALAVIMMQKKSEKEE